MTADRAFARGMDALFAPWAEGVRPGAAVAVFREGELYRQAAYGFASLEQEVPLSTSSVLRLGSTTKHLTATCALILENRGLLKLDDDVRAYIPELPDFGVRVTLRHLLTMRSGLRDHLNMLLLSGLGPDAPIGRDALLRVALASGPPMFPPGGGFVYSNTNYALTSIIIERVSSLPLGDFMARELFAPLGMSETRLVSSMSEVVAGKATGYLPTPDGGYEAGYTLCHLDGAGGVDSTLADMGRWLRNYRDDQMFGPDYRARMEAPPPGASSDFHYRLGIEVKTRRGQKVVRHAGGMYGFACDFVFYPEADIGVVLLANVLDAAMYQMADRLFDLLVDGAAAPSSHAGTRETEPSFAEGCFLSEKDDRFIALAQEGDAKALYLYGDRHVLEPAAKVWRSTKVDLYVEFRDGGLKLTAHGGKAVRFEKVDDPCVEADPTCDDVDSYLGAYRHDGLGERHEVVLEDGRLVVRLPDVARSLVWRRLLPLRTDLFVALVDGEPTRTNVTVRFLRGADGQVTALRYGFSRCVDCDFRREVDATNDD